MRTKKHVQPGEKLPLKLTAPERTLVLEKLCSLDPEIEQIIRAAPTDEPVMMALDDLDDFGGHIAAEANHCKDKKTEKLLDAIFDKIRKLLDTYTEVESPKTVKIEDARKEKLISDQTVQIAEWAAKALVAAETLGIKNKPLDKFWLAPAQREVLILVPSVTKAIKSKLATEGAIFTIGEVASMTMALAEDFPAGDAHKQVAAMYLAKQLMDQLQEGIIGTAKPRISRKSTSKPEVASGTLFQFKITLLGIKPPIWRRIQVQDCTLDKLHEHIQTAMGWTNSHLHQFEIKGEHYADPDLWDAEFELVDSTKTNLSQILPKNSKRFAFKYEYDFGDGWEHEVLFEGSPPVETGKKYPLCLEGERACPPEDVGGIYGYQNFLEAIADPKHEEHDDLLDWCGGDFSPDDFDPAKATKEMKKGLPDWRTMEDEI